MGSAKHCTICKLSSMLESVSLYNLQTVQILSCGSKHFPRWQPINAVNDMHQVASTNKRKFVGDCKVNMVTQHTIPEHSFFSYMFYELAITPYWNISRMATVTSIACSSRLRMTHSGAKSFQMHSLFQ